MHRKWHEMLVYWQSNQTRWTQGRGEVQGTLQYGDKTCYISSMHI